MAGAVQLGLGAAGAAWVLNLVSSPVLAGFTQAAGLEAVHDRAVPADQERGPVGTADGLVEHLQGMLLAPAYDLARPATVTSSPKAVCPSTST